MLLAAGAYVSTNLSFYILITYIVSYGTSVAGLSLPRGTMLAAVLHRQRRGHPHFVFGRQPVRPLWTAPGFHDRRSADGRLEFHSISADRDALVRMDHDGGTDRGVLQ